MDNMKNMKVSIGLVIAIIVQAFGLIWYVAQLDSTVTNLDTSVGALQEQATTVDVAVLQKDLENIKMLISMMEADPSRIPSFTANLSIQAASLQENANAMRALQNVALYVDREAKKG